MSFRTDDNTIKTLIGLGLLDSAGFGFLETLTETHLASSFTDGGATVGTKSFTGYVPKGAILIGSKIVVNAGFAGDTTATVTIGDGSDTDRYHTGTPNLFATAASGVESGVPSGNKLLTAANKPTITVTSSADFTPVLAGGGSVTISLYYIRTA
jgi:hypothetical protein